MKALTIVLLVCAGLAGIGFVPLLGLPGALLIKGYGYLLQPFGISLRDHMLERGPGVWNLAIVLTVLWPWGILLGFMASERLGAMGYSPVLAVAIWAAVGLLWAASLTALIVHGAIL
jgi:hypothetical protein